MVHRRAVVAALTVLAGLIGGTTIAVLRSPEGPRERTEDAALRFLATYVDPDGRVVRRDQGGDTVSEGQAYAMLLAVAAGDRERFDLVWGWTKSNLQREDGLLSWRWVDGRLADRQPAADADLDAAHALLLAAERFERASYRKEALRIAGSVLGRETVRAGGGRVLVAGPWARTRPAVVSPSYFSPAAFRLLAGTTRNAAWDALYRSSLRVVRALTRRPPHLSPDWASLDPASGAASPSGPPGGGGPAHGPNAARTIVRFAASCDPAARSLAAAAWPFLSRQLRRGVALGYDLDGEPAGDTGHPVGWVSAAAAAVAAGEHGTGERLLDRAEAFDGRAPTYFGAAWVALARAMLTTETLGTCPP